ncbi:MAG: NADP-dependent malic enzyme [Alphaproteobacteria bacterium]|jgi:malate dehydrogenase (oxaloacetate-decarboxylating)(NADP+)|nr:NADP-dependent malic enzyme [Alphaproteobacteria bacterium]MBT4019921.1 NADP-dependent malic enzyme [Alphaproteobacteria bacterium]MBT4965807.1 NADP-dependent malic enzyme [Alphaproteobacteria bacterium]MBT5158963.1 NADP-dependent malic enzyme [Alphaproteobacteria bacterium]MBT6385130.1 NADP-dependent malic enzyme [Alphaproteobacteria bacterium]
MADDLDEMALAYHRNPVPGKISVTPTKPLSNQRDLALAYSPGVAAASMAIANDPSQAEQLTARGNLVGVITNGTAVLGLGAIGPLASKPVMEGKGVLFKVFSGIDVFDIEVDETDPDRFIEAVAALEPTFGGINLEDIKAPECFEIESRLRERMNIPVFHDDQHGTAICVGAAIYNGLRVVGKKIEEVKLVCSGAGAAALACLDILQSLGLKPENVVVTDLYGVLYKGRKEDMDKYRARWAVETEARTLSDVIADADIFLGLSAPGVLKADMVKSMAAKPLIMALANPTPEITPEEVEAVRDDAVMATGRSDYPNQVNNVLCFPFLFRGALDVGATEINREMEVACLRAIANLAMAESTDIVANAYGDQSQSFGADYLIPKPFDPRLIIEIAPAVAKAAMDSGVATRPIDDFDSYRNKLTQFVYRTGFVMKPVFERASADPKRVAYAEGEDPRVLRAAQVAIDEGIAHPILIGRRAIVSNRIERLGLRLKLDQDVTLVDPENDSRYREYWQHYHGLMERKGVSEDAARTVIRTRSTVIGALMVERGDADAMLCGTVGRYTRHLRDIRDVIGKREGVKDLAALHLLLAPKNTVFIADTHVTETPSAEQLAEIAILSAEEVQRFGIEPRVALVSHSSFGTSDSKTAKRMRKALELIIEQAPDLVVEGEMRADTAIDPAVRDMVFPNSRLQGSANLLIMPTLDAASIAFNLARVLTDGLSVGPILVGAAKPAHIVSTTITVRGMVNMTALAVVDAQMQKQALV